MRVITGSAKGKRLLTPDGGEIVRPTTDMVKEAVFSIIQFDIPSARVLDLFSGSGQLGIEALSRGADYGVFTDSSPVSVKITTQNLKNCGFADISKVYRADWFAFLCGTTEKFDIAFIDPPYDCGVYNDILPAVAKKINAGGIIVCEHRKDLLIDDLPSFARKDHKYGKICVSVFRKEETE